MSICFCQFLHKLSVWQTDGSEICYTSGALPMAQIFAGGVGDRASIGPVYWVLLPDYSTFYKYCGTTLTTFSSFHTFVFEGERGDSPLSNTGDGEEDRGLDLPTGHSFLGRICSESLKARTGRVRVLVWELTTPTMTTASPHHSP